MLSFVLLCFTCFCSAYSDLCFTYTKFCDLNNESFRIIFYAALFIWPLISPLSKLRIYFRGTFHSLEITNRAAVH